MVLQALNSEQAAQPVGVKSLAHTRLPARAFHWCGFGNVLGSFGLGSYPCSATDSPRRADYCHHTRTITRLLLTNPAGGAYW